MDALVLDASVALALLLQETASLAPARVESLLLANQAWVPAIFGPEVVNGLLQACRRGRFSLAEIPLILVECARLPVRLDPESFHPEALFALAQEHHLTAYDASYLELALRRGAALATLNASLQQAARRAGVPLVV